MSQISLIINESSAESIEMLIAAFHQRMHDLTIRDLSRAVATALDMRASQVTVPWEKARVLVIKLETCDFQPNQPPQL